MRFSRAKTTLITFPIADQRIDNIQIDLVEPLTQSNGHTYLLTCVDRFGCLPEAVPISDITTSTVAQAPIASWVARFGVPSIISMDRGRNFESRLFADLTCLLGSTRMRTSSYHPQANRMVRRFNSHLRTAPRTHQTTK